MRYRHIINLFLVSLPICVLMRTIQLIFTIDSATGFIKQQYSAISVIISFIVCAAVAAVSLLSMSADGININKRLLRPGVAAISALLGGMFIYQTVSSLGSLSGGSWYNILLVFLSLLSAFTFIAYGLKNVYEYNLPSMILVIPVIYYVVKLISIFVSTSALALVTENIFLLFSNSALLWFMYEFASFENDIGDAAKKPKKLFASGIAAVMLCAVTTLPKIILFITEKAEAARGDISDVLLTVCMGAFVLIYIAYSFGEKNKTAQRPAPKHLAE